MPYSSRSDAKKRKGSEGLQHTNDWGTLEDRARMFQKAWQQQRNRELGLDEKQTSPVQPARVLPDSKRVLVQQKLITKAPKGRVGCVSRRVDPESDSE